MLLGASMKLVVAYFRTPKDLFDWDNFGGTFEDFKDRMEKIQNELDNEKPLLGWLSDLATYMMLGGCSLCYWSNETCIKVFFENGLTFISKPYIMPLSLRRGARVAKGGRL